MALLGLQCPPCALTGGSYSPWASSAGGGKELPQLQKIDPDLERVAQQIVAGDGSRFRMAGEVAWALQRRKNARGEIDSQVSA